MMNLSNEVENASTSIVAVHARRGIGSSGIFWQDNLILTSAEGVRAEEGIKIVLPDGRVVSAKLRGRDSGTDLAVLEADGVVLPKLEFLDDKTLKIGQLALAVGRTSNTGPIASAGIVSAQRSPSDCDNKWKPATGGRHERTGNAGVLYRWASLVRWVRWA